MRAHMALLYAKQKIILREVKLSDLPEEALAVSPHATVPSLVLREDEFMDESSESEGIELDNFASGRFPNGFEFRK